MSKRCMHGGQIGRGVHDAIHLFNRYALLPALAHRMMGQFKPVPIIAAPPHLCNSEGVDNPDVPQSGGRGSDRSVGAKDDLC